MASAPGSGFEGVYYDSIRKCHMVAVILDPDEAEVFATCLSYDDVGGKDLMRWAQEARDRDEPQGPA